MKPLVAFVSDHFFTFVKGLPMPPPNNIRANCRVPKLSGEARRNSVFGTLAVFTIVGLPGCFESVALDGLTRLSNAMNDLGKATIGESRSSREIVNSLPEKTKPLVEQLIEDSIKSAQTAVNEELISAGVQGHMMIDDAEFKFQSNIQQIRDSLLDAMLIIQERGLKNEQALVEILHSVKFRPVFPSPRFGLGPPVLEIDEAVGAGNEKR